MNKIHEYPLQTRSRSDAEDAEVKETVPDFTVQSWD